MGDIVRKPYVGVTGATSAEEVEAVIAEFTAAGYSMSSPHVPMLGFVVSSSNNQRAGRTYTPDLEQLIPLVRQVRGRVLPVIHFRTDDNYTLCGQVKKVFNGLYEDGSCRTLQLNWTSDPSHASQVGRNIKKDRDLHEMQIILRMGRGAMRVRTDGEIAQEIRKYGRAINYFIIAAGTTTGKFDAKRAVSLYRKFREMPHLTIGFTGNFTGANVEDRVRAIFDGIGTSKKTPSFCLSAKDGLLNAEGKLDMQEVRGYLQGAARVRPPS